MPDNAEIDGSAWLRELRAIQRNLTDAARSMREEHGQDHPRHDMWSALADWLDRVSRLAPHDDTPRSAFPGSETQHALYVAEAYLEAAARVTSPGSTEGGERA